MNGLVGDIAASAQEQATGLNQVNTAVNQMDQVTQQNAAMVEQATAAAHSLATEADTLAQLVGQFTIGTAAKSHSTASPKRAAQTQKTPPRGPATVLSVVRPSASKPPAASRAPASSSARAAPALAKADDGWDEF